MRAIGFLVCALVCLSHLQTSKFSCDAQLSAFKMKAEKRYEKHFNASFEAQEALAECRASAARTGENLHDMECFEAAMNKMAYNASWNKQYAALAMMTAQRVKANKHFNASAQITLEAQAFRGFDHGLDFDTITQLKLYRRREPAGAMELAKVWAQHLQMSQSLETAAEILEEYVVPLNHLEEAILVYRNIGNIGRMAELKKELLELQAQARKEKLKKKSKAIKSTTKTLSEVVILGEELGTSVDSLTQQWLSSVLTSTPEGLEESARLTKKVCGVTLHQKKDEFSLEQLTRHLTACVARWGKYKDLAKKSAEDGSLLKPYGVMLRTVAHQLATFNSEYLLRGVIEAAPQLLFAKDNFGRTPLHAAIAHMQPKAAALMIALGGEKLLKEKDAGNISPLKMACSTKAFREAFLQLEHGLKAPDAKSTICSEFPVQDKVHDEFDDENEEIFETGGGWDGAEQRFAEEDCDFDVRTADSISHHEIIGRYVHYSRPVVLRGAVLEKSAKELTKKALKKKAGSVRVRRELYPTSEHFGTEVEAIQNISTFMKNMTRVFGTIEMSKQHSLHDLVNYLPDKLIPPRNSYVTPGDSVPLLVMSGKNARTNYVTRIQHYFFANVYGVQDWRLSPPPSAKTTRSRAQFSTGSIQHDDVGKLKCRLQAGDMIVVPGLWSAAWKSRSEAVGYMTRFFWK